MTMNKKVNIGVIILNYIAYKETINVTNQILNLPRKENVNIRVVLVDNKSPNKSYHILKETFKNDDIVSVVQTSKNLGFANGNNYGYKVLRRMMNVDYVIFSNSDIVLKDKKLFNWILHCNENYNFGILGPSVYSLKNKIHQNPCNNWTENLKKNYKMLIHMQVQRLKLYVSFCVPKKQSDTNIRPISVKDIPDYQFATVTKTLHGSFLVMSKKYLDKFTVPFDPGTFLYMEEAILRLRCERKKIPMVYDPNYEVNHLQAVSTQKANRSALKRQIIRKNNEIKSLKRFIFLLKNFY